MSRAINENKIYEKVIWYFFSRISQPEQERETDRDREFKPTRLKNHTNDSIDCQWRTRTEKNVRTIEMKKEKEMKEEKNFGRIVRT